MNILLVAPRYTAYMYPLGIAYVCSALKAAGHEVHGLNLALEDDPLAAVERAVKAVRPQALGVGGLTPVFGQIRDILAAARRVDPGIVTVLGGGALTSEPELIFQASGADYGVFGEGEVTATELIRAIEAGQDPGGVEGIVHRTRGGRPVFTAKRRPAPELDLLPFPDFEAFGLRESLAGLTGDVSIIASRGCPFNCTFCYNVLGRHSHRMRSMDNLFAEIDCLLSKYDVKTLGLVDELFAAKPARVHEFCERIKPYGVRWHTQLRVDSVDEGAIEAMREAGCYHVQYGLESMSPAVLASMGKKITPRQIVAALELTHKKGTEAYGAFIFGDPAETLASIDETVGWWLANRRYSIHLAPIICWPGSKNYLAAVEKGLIKDKLAFIEAGCPPVNLTGLDDAVYHRVVALLLIASETLLLPAKLVEAAAKAPYVYDIACRCPHCAGMARFDAVSARAIPLGRIAAHLNCPECGLPMDIPLPMQPAGPGPEALPRLRAAEEGAGAPGGDAERAERLKDLTREFPDWAGAWHALGLTRLRLGMQDHAFEALRQAVRNNPFEPAYLASFAGLLADLGFGVFARAFDEQAAIVSLATRAVSGAPGGGEDHARAAAILQSVGIAWGPGEEPSRDPDKA
ncbi:MAG: B12-binding domain-containing radical SAM protein [Desulfovibrionaceae bacterium]|nr:B12-binding domain-containing radical SAM protein [Desulfovibrionaceae bacterium]MBF0512687.1 B12-binding domain-containing radical SAM protein [Desulfovibrionaceae bacterium]